MFLVILSIGIHLSINIKIIFNLNIYIQNIQNIIM